MPGYEGPDRLRTDELRRRETIRTTPSAVGYLSAVFALATILAVWSGLGVGTAFVVGFAFGAALQPRARDRGHRD